MKESQLAPVAPPSIEVETKLGEERKHVTEQESQVLNIAPKKVNWDLKRDVEKKLQKLNRRTQKAIAELLSTKRYLLFVYFCSFTYLNTFFIDHLEQRIEEEKANESGSSSGSDSDSSGSSSGDDSD